MEGGSYGFFEGGASYDRFGADYALHTDSYEPAPLGGTAQHGELADISSDLSWREQARCLGVDPGLMYPDEEDEEAIEGAKAVCADCPVSDPCLEEAIAKREKDGVAGGLTARERRRIIRQRRSA